MCIVECSSLKSFACFKDHSGLWTKTVKTPKANGPKGPSRRSSQVAFKRRPVRRRERPVTLLQTTTALRGKRKTNRVGKRDRDRDRDRVNDNQSSVIRHRTVTRRQHEPPPPPLPSFFPSFPVGLMVGIRDVSDSQRRPIGSL